MVHDAGEIGIGECNPAVRCLAQDIAWSRLAVFAEEEARLWAEVGVAPAIQNDAGDIAIGIEAGTPKHGSELFPDSPFVCSKGRRYELGSSSDSLLLKGETRVRE